MEETQSFCEKFFDPEFSYPIYVFYSHQREYLCFLSEVDVGVVGFGEGGLDEQSCEDVEDA